MPERLIPLAICTACGAGKDLPLARCAACGEAPVDRELALLASDRFLSGPDRIALQERIRKGERLNPGASARAQARQMLASPDTPLILSNRQMWLLALANLLLTPVLGYAVWFRARGAPAGTQALLVTVPISLALGIGAVAWRWWSLHQVAP